MVVVGGPPPGPWAPPPPLPAHPCGVPWPTVDWPQGPVAPDVDSDRLVALLDLAFGPTARTELDRTLATVVVHRGRLVAERYHPEVSPDDTLISWSMAKSVTHALVGLLVADGRLDPSAPAPVPAWQRPGDPRGAITLQHLLTMTSGLRFVEDYVDDTVSDVIEMLFGSGKDDVAGFAAAFPLEHPPGSVFNYSSGTTNIIARIAGDAVGDADAVRDYLHRRLFEPTGMRSAVPRFDTAGTFIGSSFLYCTARDFARFGLLYARGGNWEGRPLLPSGWVDHARHPIGLPTGEECHYGAHWWLWEPETAVFAAHGYEGQYLAIDPGRDLVLVRLGKTPTEQRPRVRAWLRELTTCFPPVA
jgi:CubicO group peptidase (beta-lactamase class C family)